MVVAHQLHLHPLVAFAATADADAEHRLFSGCESGQRIEDDGEVFDAVGRRPLGVDRFEIAQQRRREPHAAGGFRPLVGDADDVFRHAADLDRVFAVGDLEEERGQAFDLDRVRRLIRRAIAAPRCRDDLLRSEIDGHQHHLDGASLTRWEFLQVPEHAVETLLVPARMVCPHEFHARRQLGDQFDRPGRRRSGVDHRQHAGRRPLEVAARRHFGRQLERGGRDLDADWLLDLEPAIGPGCEAGHVDARPCGAQHQIDRP